MATKDLESFGYIHSRKLTLADRHAISPPKKAPLRQVPDSLCVYYDVLVEDRLVDSTNTCYGQFYQVISASSAQPIRPRQASFISSAAEQRRFVKNDERRDNLISEFICTEDNYVANLRAFITSIVYPIRSRARDKQRKILGPYECGKIFMNIEQVLQVNEAFRLDLARYQSSPHMDFGEMCLMHLRRFVTCYHKFLLGVENAQSFNLKEQKDNATYEAYLNVSKKGRMEERWLLTSGLQQKMKDSMGNQTVYAYLALPGQRVGRYTLFLKELIKHTTDDHPNLPGLTEALKTAEEIANMSEDYHTKLIKIFHNMLQSIQNCPASLLSQQRSLICHVDAAEIDPHTLKPAHPVTLFLFTDKLMVVRRPSYAADGLELCGLDHERDKSGKVSLLARKAESSKRYERKLKFRGWMSLNDIDIHDGAAELPTSFTLVTNITESPPADVDPQTRDALEGYFLEDSLRLFQLAGEDTSKPMKLLMQEKQKFIEQFGRTKTGYRRSDDLLLESTDGQWKGRYFFANIYRLSAYHLLANKNDIAIAYIDGSIASLKLELSNCYTIPHMLGFLTPDKENHRFSIRSKLALGCATEEDPPAIELSTQTEAGFQNFRDRFLGNLYACDKDLREVGRMANSLSAHGRRQRVRYSDTKPMRMTLHKELSRRRSISTFKLFSNLGNSSASTARRKSSTSDELMKTSGLLESRISATYSSTTSSSTISGSEDDTLDDTHRKRRSTAGGTLAAVRRKSLTETIASAYRPSIHPTQSVSYELSSKGGKRESRDDYDAVLEDRVKQLSATLQNQFNKERIARPESSESNTSMRTTPSRLSVSPEQYSTSSFSTYRNSSRETLTSLSGTSNVSTPLSHDLMLGKPDRIQVDEKVSELLAQIKGQSPVSTASSDSIRTPSPAIAPDGPNTLDKMMAEMDLMKSEFNRRYDAMIHDYEEMGAVVRQLTKELKKKDEEMAILRVRYQDAMSENDLLYEAFNNELDQMYEIFDRRTQVDDKDTIDSRRRPSHPSPEAQVRRKLELTIKERNQWHQTACKLARELQDQSQGFIRPTNSRSTPTPPFRHSTQ
ncbi:hypothetical protein BJV82DRAFT_673801 [Fennellomyces sp. T-0311]|nr:hypothetical protein BJV82DRAFT_673801 [Fennellomyces sp. T-0311]